MCVRGFALFDSFFIEGKMVYTRGHNLRRDGASASITPPVQTGADATNVAAAVAANVNGNRGNIHPVNQRGSLGPMPPPPVNPLRVNEEVVEQIPNTAELYNLVRTLQAQLAQTQEQLNNALAENAERTDGNFSVPSQNTEPPVDNNVAPNVNAAVVPPNVVQTPRFKFESFQKCGGQKFNGTLNAVGCMEWLDDTEMVFEACDCPEDKKVLCASRMLKEGARDWWKSITVSMTPTTVSAITWATFKQKFIEEYIGVHEQRKMEKEFRALTAEAGKVNAYARSFLEKMKFVGHLFRTDADQVACYVDGLPPSYRGICRQHKTLTEAIKESKKLDDDFASERKVEKNNDERKPDNKRKFSGSNRFGKKFRGSSASDKGKTATDGKWCSGCKAIHSGQCSARTRRCNRCGAQGHAGDVCTDKARCYKCGDTNHRIADCPKMRKDDGKQAEVPKAKARAFQMTTEEARDNDEVVTATLIVNPKFANVLFDFGVNKSFVSLIV